MRTMKAAVFVKPGKIVLDEKPVPKAGPGEALVKITTTTICGTDVHILKGEYPVKPGLTIGHEPVGVIEELGTGVTGYRIGQRVLVGAADVHARSLADGVETLEDLDLVSAVFLFLCHAHVLPWDAQAPHAFV